MFASQQLGDLVLAAVQLLLVVFSLELDLLEPVGQHGDDLLLVPDIFLGSGHCILVFVY